MRILKFLIAYIDLRDRVRVRIGFVEISANGTVEMDVSKLFTSSCTTKMRKFPFDEAECALQFYFAQYIWDHQHIQLGISAFHYRYGQLDSDQWKVTADDFRAIDFRIEMFEKENVNAENVNAENGNAENGNANRKWVRRPQDERPIAGFLLTAHLRRYPTYYVINILVPTLIVTAVGLFTVLLPPETDKIGVAASIQLGFFFVQTRTSALFPLTQEAPLLETFTILELSLAALNLVFTLISVVINKLRTEKAPPERLSCGLYCLARLVRYQPKSITPDGYLPCSETADAEPDCLDSPAVKHVHETHEKFWQEAAQILNRFFSAVYFLGSLTIILVFLSLFFFD